MPKLGVVPPKPDPVDPFKKQGPPPLGVVEATKVDAVPEKAPRIGAVRQNSGQVVSVPPPPPPKIGVVPPAVSTNAEPQYVDDIPVGIHTDTTPVYPPPPPVPKPKLGEVREVAITPPKPQDDLLEPPAPRATQPIVIDPHAPKD